MPPRKLGQHFLIRGSILERIAAAACPARQDLVVEIGPGRGALTEKLLKRAARVVAVEVDPRLAERLHLKFAVQPRLEIVCADVLQTDLAQWGRATIAGNLPYYITSPILHRLFECAGRIASIHIVIQLEVAERIVAHPGCRDYGYLSTICQFYTKPAIVMRLPPDAFRPPPKVTSALVQMTLPGERASLGIGGEDEKRFLEFVQLCFGQKRKTLRNNLRSIVSDEQIRKAVESNGIRPDARAEQLTIAQFAALFAQLR